MTFDSSLSNSLVATVDWLYAGLIRAAETGHALDPQRGLGGKLFYAGDLDGVGSDLVVAANVHHGVREAVADATAPAAG